MSVTCYPSPGKVKAMRICTAFAEGCGGTVASPGHTRLEPGPAFFYGWTEHTVPLIRLCQAEGRDWLYADNAYYLGRGKYFRITKNALMHSGIGDAAPERFMAFGVDIKPWSRDPDGHVVIATQSEAFYLMQMRLSRDDWTRRIIEKLGRHTRRRVVVCHKPDAREMRPDQPHAPGFEAHLVGAWALVTHSSSAAVKALLEGVPVFCEPECMAATVGCTDLAMIGRPNRPDGREFWAWVLAANQWSLDEMRSGLAWRMLNGERA